MTDRLKRMYAKIQTNHQHIGIEKFKIITKTEAECFGYPAILRRGVTLKNVLEQFPIFIGEDELFVEAGRAVVSSKKATIGYLQRMLKIGFNRAARIMDALADAEVVGPEQGTKPREILMTEEEFESFLQSRG